MIVYVLRSLKDGKLYIGMTKNLLERLKRHEQDKVRSTRHRRPFQLPHAEEFQDCIKARRREKYLKSGSGHLEISRMLSS